MDREIKFRAWDKISNKMRFFILAHKHSILTDLPIPSKGQWEHLSDFMQFIGFKDWNGKEIYEGDILSGVPYNQEVYFDNEKCAFGVKEYLTEFTRKWDISQEDINYNKREVIGNIHKTPELIKDKEELKSD